MLGSLSDDDLLAAIESIGNPTFVVDVGADGTLRYLGVNAANTRFSGRTTADVRGRRPVEVMSPQLAARLEERYRACIESGAPLQYEQLVEFATGPRWLFTALTPLHDADGRIRRILGNSFDVTERRKVEAELAETRDFLQTVIDHLPAIVFCKDARDLRYTLINRMAEPMFGTAEVVGKDDYDFYPREQADFFRRVDRQALDSGQPVSIEAEPVRTPDGDRILRTRKVPIGGRDGRPRFLLGISEDVTDRALAERRLHDAVESLRDGFMLFDRDDRVVLHNRRFLEIYPYLAPLAPLEGRPFREMLEASREWRRSVDPEAEVEEYVRLRLAHWRSFSETPLEASLPDGGWVMVSERPTADGGVVAIHTDITQLKQRQEQLAEVRDRLQQQTQDLIRLTNDLRHARRRAEEANVAKSQFLAMISHELRTPFTGIRGMADLLAATRLDADQGRYLDVMRRSIDRLLALLDQILDFSRIEAGRMEIDEAPMSPARVIEDVATMFRPTALTKGLSLEASVGPDVPARILGDAQKINQVLANLIGNGVKFTERGGIAIGVSVDRGADGEMLRWRVSDTGIGLAEDQIARLFEPFSQADNSTTRRFGGTGLGLAISKRLAEAMGGAIGVESRAGRGSTFWFTTRLHPIAAGGSPPDRRAAAAVGAPAATGGAVGARRVLIAEDDTINQMLIETMLRQWGYDTRVVEDGVQAIALLEREAFDVVLMDVNMPRLDGPAAVRLVRAGGGRPAALPIFAITADTMPEHVDRYRAAGFDEVLTKPVDWARLRGLIERAAARRSA